MEIYSSKKMELRWDQFWDPFSVTFTCQPLKIRFLIPSINLIIIYYILGLLMVLKTLFEYADDILLLINSTDEINTTQETFQNNYVLNFTLEININNKIQFLGILIDTSNIDRFTTSTYKKPANINPCTLNFHSECPFRYQRTIIKTLISKATLLPSFRTIFLNELKKI